MTYALGRGVEYYDEPAVRGDRPRRASRDDYPLRRRSFEASCRARRSRWRESREVRYVHHQTGAAAPDLPSRRSAWRWGCRCSTRWCRRCRRSPTRLRRWRRGSASSTCRTASPRTSSGIDYWTPSSEGRNFEMSQILAPLEPFRDRMLVVSGLDQNQAEAGNDGASGDHTRGTSSWLTGVLPQAHRRRRRPQRHLRRSDRGVGARQGHGAAVARARHRSQLPRRAVREQLQLRLPQHARLDVADDAAADREQSARRVRAAVRRRRHRGAARRAGAAEPQHPRFGPRRLQSPAAAARARRSRASSSE